MVCVMRNEEGRSCTFHGSIIKEDIALIEKIRSLMPYLTMRAFMVTAIL